VSISGTGVPEISEVAGKMRASFELYYREKWGKRNLDFCNIGFRNTGRK